MADEAVMTILVAATQELAQVVAMLIIQVMIIVQHLSVQQLHEEALAVIQVTLIQQIKPAAHAQVVVVSATLVMNLILHRYVVLLAGAVLAVEQATLTQATRQAELALVVVM